MASKNKLIKTKKIADDAAQATKDLAPISRKEIFKHSEYPYDTWMRKKQYEAEKAELQIELLKLQHWVKDKGKRIAILFEGRDAAGKGGTIKRFTEHMNPRGARVVALEKPNKIEKGQWYFQRYIERLPTRGEIVFFDRSWYNRAGVEKVMGFCTDKQHQDFLRQAPEFERMLAEDGVLLFKLYFSVSRDEQNRRFLRRMHDPLKQWKMSDIDRASVGLWQEYTNAKQEMFKHTDTTWAPWTVIKSDDKKRARLNAMRYVLASLNYPNKSKSVNLVPDHLIVGPVVDMTGDDTAALDVKSGRVSAISTPKK